MLSSFPMAAAPATDSYLGSSLFVDSLRILTFPSDEDRDHLGACEVMYLGTVPCNEDTPSSQASI